MNGWDKLFCGYFSATCINELRGPLGRYGFTVVHTALQGAVTFKRFDVFIEIGYEVETAPDYSPTVVIGFGDKKYDKAGRPTSVPLWFAIPDDQPARTYSFWKFSSESQLREVLRKIYTEVLDIHAQLHWQHPEVLQRAVSNFRAECG